METEKIPIPLGIYRHYKGNEYEVIGFAKHSETLEDMVVYRQAKRASRPSWLGHDRTSEVYIEYKALYGEGGTWVRPLSMWENLIEIDGKTVKRFEYIYRNKDHEAFCNNGIADLYETIGSLNLFMQCDTPNKAAFRDLPPGFLIRPCRRDELDIWMKVVVEAQYVKYVADFYEKVYAKHKDEFFRRCLFVCNEIDKPVASTFIWRSYGLINTVGWFRTLPEYEGLGLGKALLSEVLGNAEFPIYLHTQPTSARAIKLYSDFGFKLVTDPVVGHRKNDLQECLPYLQKLLPKNDYDKLQFVKANEELLSAAASNEFAEF